MECHRPDAHPACHIGLYVNLEIHHLDISQRGTFCKPDLQTKSDRGKEVAQGTGSLTITGATVRFVTLKGEMLVVLDKLGTSVHVVDECGFYERPYMTDARLACQERGHLFHIGAEFGVVDPDYDLLDSSDLTSERCTVPR